MDTTTDPRLCQRCLIRPAAEGQTIPVPDYKRVSALTTDPDPVVAHVASASLAVRREVEDWKKLAAAETDPAKAENLRKAAVVASDLAAQLAVVVQDAKAVSVP